MQANRHQGHPDRSRLADTYFAAELLYIENFNVQQVAITDDVVMLHDPRGGGLNVLDVHGQGLHGELQERTGRG